MDQGVTWGGIMNLMTRLRSFFAPPLFPDDEKTRVAGLLHANLLAIIVLYGVYDILALVVPAISTRRLLSTAPILILGLALMPVLRRGYVRLASAILCASLWTIGTGATIFGGGVAAPAFSGYFLVVLIAGLLLGWRAALAFAG